MIRTWAQLDTWKTSVDKRLTQLEADVKMLRVVPVPVLPPGGSPPPPPIGGSWPNQPVGWSPLGSGGDYPMPAITIPTGGGVPIGDGSGWGIVQSAGPPVNVTRITDLTAPMSPPDVMQMSYPTGFLSGIAPGTLYYVNPGANPSKLYIGLWWKPSNPWQGHETGVNKILFVWFGGGSPSDNLEIQMYGSVGGPFATRMVGEGWEDVSYTENVGSPAALTLGAWHQLEILINEPAEALKWWRDGLLVGDYTSVPRRVSSPGTSQPYPVPFRNELIHISPTYGGSGGPKTEDDFYWYDHIRICAP